MESYKILNFTKSGTKVGIHAMKSDADGNGVNIASQFSAQASAISDLENSVFPLKVEYGTKNNGTFEYGTSVTPSVSWTAKRKNDVAIDTVTLGTGVDWGTLSTDKKSYLGVATELKSTIKFSASVKVGDETKALSEISWNPSFYRYRGELSSVPTDFAVAIKALTTKELSTSTTLGSTDLPANKYYLFAVKSDTPVTLVAHNAASGGKIEGSITGTATILQENEYKSNTYYYILVPKSENSWKFNIQNS